MRIRAWTMSFHHKKVKIPIWFLRNQFIIYLGNFTMKWWTKLTPQNVVILHIFFLQWYTNLFKPESSTMLSSENSIAQSLTKNGQKQTYIPDFRPSYVHKKTNVKYKLVNWRIAGAKKWFKPEASTMLSSRYHLPQRLTKNGQKTNIYIQFLTLLRAQELQSEIWVNWRAAGAEKWFKPKASKMLISWDNLPQIMSKKRLQDIPT